MFLFDYFFTKKYEPKIGMLLEDKIWGRDYTLIKVERISKDKTEILYSFITTKGRKSLTNDLYDANWFFLILDTYDIIEE